MTDIKFPVLKNKYISLEPFKEKHVTNGFVNSLNNKDINRYLGVRKKKQTKKTALKYYLDRLKNKDYYYAIIENKNSKLIGTITLKIAQGYSVIGNMICNKKYFGSLEGKIAFQIFLDFCFNTLKVSKIYGGTEKNNIASNFNATINNFELIQKTKNRFKFMLRKKNHKKKINYKIINNE